MARPEVRVVLLYEDRAHYSFMRRLVERLRIDLVRYENCSNSAGVLARLGREVDALRSLRFQRNLGLIIVIDADAPGLSGRVRELEQRIQRDARDGARTPEERVAFVVPALEIENWYVHLCFASARPVDEARDYKPSAEWRELGKDLGAAAKRAVAEWGPMAGRSDPPSIDAARPELERVR